ncbi:hypothetical protein JGU71_16550 [Antrihabitans sp. YC3-6]|uniref:Uncharacterized protein n=1 Tax=Antrihabitans stalagmiti TaxID=2799499 RepID=A0A934U4M5_9NOCA|nr:hypothetical protein [Antrihabitans stalagmiti]MBJ8340502.1 hypothetical protein [Antrihabitans stalagmiti]
MSGIPIVIIAFFFAVVDFAWRNVWLVVPAMIAVWLLLFVPSRTWASMRASIAAPFRRRASAPPVSTPLSEQPRRELVHSK